MPPACQLASQLSVVVYLSVEYDGQLTGLIGYRLITGFQIDDAQTSDSQIQRGGLVETMAIRSAVTDRLSHPLDQPLIAISDHAGNAAHTFRPIRFRLLRILKRENKYLPHVRRYRCIHPLELAGDYVEDLLRFFKRDSVKEKRVL